MVWTMEGVISISNVMDLWLVNKLKPNGNDGSSEGLHYGKIEPLELICNNHHCIYCSSGGIWFLKGHRESEIVMASGLRMRNM